MPKTIWIEAQAADGSPWAVVAQGFRNVDAAAQHAESISESYHAVAVHYKPIRYDPLQQQDRGPDPAQEPKGP